MNNAPYPIDQVNENFYFYIYPPIIPYVGSSNKYLSWYKRIQTIQSASYLYTLDANVTGEVINTLTLNDSETNQQFVTRALNLLTVTLFLLFLL